MIIGRFPESQLTEELIGPCNSDLGLTVVTHQHKIQLTLLVQKREQRQLVKTVVIVKLYIVN